MLQIDSLIYVLAFMAVAVNACCFFMWWDFKTVKSHKVQKKLAKFYKWSTAVLAVVLIGNAIIMKVSGGYVPDPAHTLLYIIIQGIFGYGCTRILKKNYIEKMREGKKYPFIISSIGTKIYGYLIIGQNWIEAIIDNPVKKVRFSETFETEATLVSENNAQDIKCLEEQQVDVTLVSAGSEDCEVVVRV